MVGDSVAYHGGEQVSGQAEVAVVKKSFRTVSTWSTICAPPRLVGDEVADLLVDDRRGLDDILHRACGGRTDRAGVLPHGERRGRLSGDGVMLDVRGRDTGRLGEIARTELVPAATPAAPPATAPIAAAGTPATAAPIAGAACGAGDTAGNDGQPGDRSRNPGAHVRALEAADGSADQATDDGRRGHRPRPRLRSHR